MAKNKEEIRKGPAGNGITEVVFIMDRSGSMSGLEADTIGGFNSMLEKQKKEDGSVIWSTVIFDDVSEVIHDRMSIEDINPLTEDEYYVRGMTALFDAVGGSIHHIGNVHKYAREDDRPDKTIFIITTDGMENASVVYSSHDVKRMIKRQQERYGWEFIFLGANMDAVEAAGRIGIRRDRAARFHNDEIGVALNYSVVSEEISAMRSGGVVGDSLTRVRDDYKKRKKTR